MKYFIKVLAIISLLSISPVCLEAYTINFDALWDEWNGEIGNAGLSLEQIENGFSHEYKTLKQLTSQKYDSVQPIMDEAYNISEKLYLGLQGNKFLNKEERAAKLLRRMACMIFRECRDSVNPMIEKDKRNILVIEIIKRIIRALGFLVFVINIGDLVFTGSHVLQELILYFTVPNLQHINPPLRYIKNNGAPIVGVVLDTVATFIGLFSYVVSIGRPDVFLVWGTSYHLFKGYILRHVFSWCLAHLYVKFFPGKLRDEEFMKSQEFDELNFEILLKHIENNEQVQKIKWLEPIMWVILFNVVVISRVFITKQWRINR